MEVSIFSVALFYLTIFLLLLKIFDNISGTFCISSNKYFMRYLNSLVKRQQLLFYSGVSEAAPTLWVSPHHHNLARALSSLAPSSSWDKLLSSHVSSSERPCVCAGSGNAWHYGCLINNHDKIGLRIFRLFPTGFSDWNPGRAPGIKLLFNRQMDEFIERTIMWIYV